MENLAKLSLIIDNKFIRSMLFVNQAKRCPKDFRATSKDFTFIRFL